MLFKNKIKKIISFLNFPYSLLFAIFISLSFLASNLAYAEDSSDDLSRMIEEAIYEADKRLASHQKMAEKSKRPVVSHQKTQKKKTAFKTMDVGNLVQEASTVYKKNNDYLSAYELSANALRIDPDNKAAQKIQETIQKDLDDKIIDLVPYNQKYTPPEGILSYKVAVSDGVIDQEEAVQIAMESSIELKALSKRVDGSRHKVVEAKRGMWPTVTAEVAVNGGIIIGAYTGESFKVNVSQPVFYGGELIFTVKQAELNLESDRLKYEKAKLDLAGSVKEAYQQTITAHHNLVFQNELYEQSSVYRETSQKAYDRKLIPEIEYLDISSTFNQINFQKESAYVGLKASKLSLRQILSLDLKQPLPIDTEVKFKEKNIDLGQFTRMVKRNNLDIRIADMAARTSYYGVKVFEAQKLPRIDIRGSVGLAGELFVDIGSSPDLENEHFIGITAEMPLGANSLTYGFQRRFFAPTVSSFQGSEDFRHILQFGLLDKLANVTDEIIAKADYLQSKAELQSEIMTQEIAARSIYFDYQSALMQLELSESKVKFREKQIAILKHSTMMEESRVSALLNEMVTLAEDKFSIVNAMSEASLALSSMSQLVGIKGYYDR